MYIFAEPVTEEQVAKIQNANLEEAQEFERGVLGRDPKQEDAPKWADLQANVEEAMNRDQLSLEEVSESELRHESSDDEAIIDRGPLHDDLSYDAEDGIQGVMADDRDNEDEDGVEEEAEKEDDENEDDKDDEEEEEEEQEEEEGTDANKEELIEGETDDLVDAEQIEESEQQGGGDKAHQEGNSADEVVEEEIEAEAGEGNDGKLENVIADEAHGDGSSFTNNAEASDDSGDGSKLEASVADSTSSSPRSAGDSATLIDADGPSENVTEADRPFLDTLSSEHPRWIREPNFR